MAVLQPLNPSITKTPKGGGTGKVTRITGVPSPKTGESEERAARGQVLRQLLISYKNTDKSCKFCPTHPEAPVEWTAGKGYTRLKCLHEKGHAINIFAMLENFNLDPLPEYCQVDLAYIYAKYVQESRAMDVKVTYPLQVAKVSQAQALALIDSPTNASAENMKLAMEAGRCLALKNISENRAMEEIKELKAEMLASPVFSFDEELAVEGEMAEETVEKEETDAEEMDTETEFEEVQKILQRAKERQASPTKPTKPRKDNNDDLLALLDDGWQEGNAPRTSLFSTQQADTGSNNKFNELPVDPLPVETSAAPTSKLTLPPIIIKPKAPSPKSADKAEAPKGQDRTPAPLQRGAAEKSATPTGSKTPTAEAPKVLMKRSDPESSSEEEAKTVQVTAKTTTKVEGVFRLPATLGTYSRSAGCPLTLPAEGSYTLSFNRETQTFTCERQGTMNKAPTYAAATAAHAKANAQAKAVHVEKLKTDAEYAKKYVATGIVPRPPRSKTKLISLFCRDMKAVPRNELRIILRNIGVDTRKVANIGFYQGKCTYVTVPDDYAKDCHRLLSKIAPSSITEDPITALGWYSKDGADVLENFAGKMVQEADEARKRGRIGLANYFNEFGVGSIARCSPEVFSKGKNETEKIADLKLRHGWNGLERMAVTVMNEHLAWEVALEKKRNEAILRSMPKNEGTSTSSGPDNTKGDNQTVAKVDATTGSSNTAVSSASNGSVAPAATSKSQDDESRKY